MPVLRLGTYKLPAAEVILVRTLMRLYAHDSAFRWTFVDTAPYDALLVDGTTADGNNGEAARLARAVLKLTRMNEGDGSDTIERPLRADKLQAWLKRAERDFVVTRPMTQPGEPVVEAAPSGPTPGIRFKLRRWPPATMLRNDPQRIRMATLMSRRALQVSELATISGQPLNECQTFVRNLQLVGLLDVQEAAPPPAAPAVGTAPAASAAATPARPSFARGLIGNIRKRLGL